MNTYKNIMELQRRYEMMSDYDKRFVCGFCFAEFVVSSLREQHETKCECNEAKQAG